MGQRSSKNLASSGQLGTSKGLALGPGRLLRHVPWFRLPHLWEHADRVRNWSPNDYHRKDDTIRDAYSD